MLTKSELQLTNQLKTARGETFVVLLKQAYQELSPKLAQQANSIIESKGNLTLANVVDLALAYNLQLKHCFDFLEEYQVLPTGTYQLLLDRGLKPTKAIEQRKKINNQNATI